MNAADSTSSGWQPNSDYLSSLINDLGISERKAIKALKLTNNESVEAAASYVFDNLIDEREEQISEELEAFYNQELDRIKNTEQEAAAAAAAMSPTSMIKMVFVVNCSLKMNVGKIASQVAHAAIDLYEESTAKQPALNLLWQQFGQTKIVLKGKDDAELLELSNLAKNEKVITTLIYDAGRTEVKSGSLTCLGLFGRVGDIDKITGKLSLLKDLP